MRSGRLFFTLLCLIFCAIVANAVDLPALRMVPSSFRLQAADINYQGENCSGGYRITETDITSGKVLKVGDTAYYDPGPLYQTARGDGFVVDRLFDGTCTIFRMSGLVKTGGWQYRDPDDLKVPDSIRGLFKVKDTVWMGSNGIGLAVYDLTKKTWSRIDLKSTVVSGDHLNLDYADEDYVFVTRGEFPGASVHVYSVKLNKWLGLKAVSNKLFSEYGYTTGIVQVNVDHRQLAKANYFPIDWTFMGIRPALVDDGSAYRISKWFSENNKTVFTIAKAQLEDAFADASRQK